MDKVVGVRRHLRTRLAGRFGALVTAGTVAGLLLGAQPAAAETLQEMIPSVLDTHDRILAARAELDAAQNRAREALGEWFPTLSLDGEYGWEGAERPEQSNTDLEAWEYNFTLTQLLWDFGSTNGQVEAQRLVMGQTKATLDATRQQILLRAVTAYVNLIRSVKILEFARQSEDNVRRQTGLEEARVQRGSGLTTDVLQAKTQLAGAEARRIQAEGALQIALNRYQAVFGSVPADVSALVEVVEPGGALLPETLDDALTYAYDNNPTLRSASFAAAAQRQVVRSTRGSEFFPRVELVGESSHKYNIAQIRGHKVENSVKVQASWDINLGATAINTLRAAQADAVAADRSWASTRRQVEEQVRNAWQNLITFRANATILANQANIAGEFLDLARRERQLGQRSLIDLLAGETALFNAQSDAYSARADVVIAGFNLMNAMGNLEVNTIQ